MENVYYQPILNKEEWEEGILNSFDVYREYRNAKEDFPNHIIAAYSGDDIEEPSFIDDERSITFYVDIPQLDSEEWLNVETFKTRHEAIEFAKERFGADENGMVRLVSY